MYIRTIKRKNKDGSTVEYVQLAHNAGATGILVLTGEGRAHQQKYPPEYSPPHAICRTLYEAAEWIVAAEEKKKSASP